MHICITSCNVHGDNVVLVYLDQQTGLQVYFPFRRYYVSLFVHNLFPTCGYSNPRHYDICLLIVSSRFACGWTSACDLVVGGRLYVYPGFGQVESEDACMRFARPVTHGVLAH
jgi:hypothetical protein